MQVSRNSEVDFSHWRPYRIVVPISILRIQGAVSIGNTEESMGLGALKYTGTALYIAASYSGQHTETHHLLTNAVAFVFPALYKQVQTTSLSTSTLCELSKDKFIKRYEQVKFSRPFQSSEYTGF